MSAATAAAKTPDNSSFFTAFNVVSFDIAISSAGDIENGSRYPPSVAGS
jgi:hypothetical protein